MSSYNEASSHKTVQIINIVLYSYADIAYVHVTVMISGTVRRMSKTGRKVTLRNS